MKQFVRHAILAVFLTLTSLVAIATPYIPRLTQLEHKIWREQDSGVHGANSLVQTTDGFFWIATDSGLMRFDGVRFVPKNQFGKIYVGRWQITAMVAGLDGSLWLGTQGHVLKISGETVEEFDIKGRANQIIEDKHGTIWVTQTRLNGKQGPVCSIEAKSLHCYGAPELRYPLAFGLTPDEDGSFWVQGDEGLCRWKPGTQDECYLQAMLRTAKGLVGVTATLRSRDKTLWVGIADTGDHPHGLGQLVDGNWTPFIAPDFDGSKLDVCCLTEDAGGALWVGTYNHGLYRIRANVIEHFDKGDGLTSSDILAIVIDAEGTVWVTTTAGIDAFRVLPVSTFAASEGLSDSAVMSVLAAKSDVIWIGTQPLNAMQDGRRIPVLFQGVAPTEQTMAMLEDHAGKLWFGQGGKLFVRDGATRTEVLDSAGSSTGGVIEMAEAPNGDVWAMTAPGHRLLVIRKLTFEELKLEKEIRSFTADPSGNGMWILWQDYTVSHYTDGKLQAIKPAGKDLGTANDIRVESDGTIFLAFQRAIAMYRGAQWTLLDVQHGLPCETVRSTQRDAHGDLWAFLACGHMRIEKVELNRWLGTPRTIIKSRLLTDADGFEAGSAPARPRMSVAPDGKIWFATEKSIQMVDPARLPPPRPAPAVDIDAVVADRLGYSLAHAIKLPSGTRDITVTYTAPSSVAAQTIKFKYWLVGRDATWHEVGDRREAVYTDLPPGAYTFRVTAANSDGVWNETGRAIGFEIAPAYYQTTWFRVLCVAGFALTLYGLYMWRLRQVETKLRDVMAAKNAERERIARDLHDTLLQSTEGLVLLVQATCAKLAKDSPERALFDKALLRASALIAEGRDRVQGLRSAEDGMPNLKDELTRLGEGFAEEHAGTFTLSEDETARPWRPAVSDAMYMIAREALLNAFRHGKARSVSIRLGYSNKTAQMVVADDGMGMDVTAANAEAPHGHWGIKGMYERAARVGGHLDIQTRAGGGTEINFTLPASAAFEPIPHGQH